MTTKGAVYVAIAASMGNMLQGWDNATIAGAVLYIKKEFHLETQPTIEGLIVSMSLIGATVITTFSGSVSDAIGRRPMLIISSLFYFMSGLVMFWSPSVYVLLVARLLDGFGIGLAVTLVPLYISETAPSDIRGLLNTFPQFTGCVGMFLAYTMVFFMSLQSSASWRMMLGVLSLPSIAYFILAVFYLPESPRWLVSKGKMDEAKHVLQLLRGKEDVSGEMALLVEGLEVGALIVGVGIQILQQFSGINGVLYYTPQILEQAGVGILLANMGIGSESASFLISGVTTLLMLPSIGVAMKLIDLAGRRMLLLATLPVLLASLIVLVLSNTIPMDSVVHAVISTVSVVVYFCTFVMGFGPIPNTLCSEIFPTRVRGLCIAICALTFWVGDIIVTYTLPVLLTTIGLAGAFGIYAVVCTISWFFVYFKVPETKGMPLEVITEFFAMGAANKKAN
ncbi:putative major facilitator, sugar transporter, major facilitator superfamily [Helianthus annuus]|nr:putative major facilitator, sugar transporter, major facilitator superfamily [Helianthus annuus]